MAFVVQATKASPDSWAPEPRTLEHAIETLNERVQLVRNTTSVGRGIGAAQQAWLQRWEATDAQLRNMFVESDVAEIAVTVGCPCQNGAIQKPDATAAVTVPRR